jgi:predicted SprT family Zn-dependent metalloprotease
MQTTTNEMGLLNLIEVKAVVKEVCERCGRPEVAERINLKWSGRMTSAMGNASRKSMTAYHYTIKLSTPLFLRATVDERRQTVIHEVCHVLDGIVNNVKMSHGSSWKAMMRRAGVDAKRCHTVDNTGLRKASKTYRYVCPHGHKAYDLGAIRHRNMQSGSRTYLCPVCRTKLNWAP